jgi:ABC-type antimicrobial peptide transport system permease subunit
MMETSMACLVFGLMLVRDALKIKPMEALRY